MGVTVDMNGVPLAHMDQAGALTLNTAGKYVAGNIGLQYTSPLPYDSTPSASTASGSAGSSAAYSRGDHAHPIDTTRAAASDLTALAQAVAGKLSTTGGTRIVTAEDSGGTNTYKFAGGGEEDDSTVARIGDIPYKRMTATEMLLGVYGLVTRAVTGFVASSGATTATFGFGSTPGGDTVIDCLLDVDNSGNSSDFGLEFHGLGTSYALAVNADEVTSSKTAGEVLAEMTVVEAGTRARLYFTEANQTQVATVGNESVDLPILTVQRMTIAPTTVRGGAA